MKLLELSPDLRQRRQFNIWDDFFWYISPHLWTSLAADAGSSVAAGDTTGGNLVLTTGATNNNECAVATTKKVFLLASEKPLIFETSLQYSEAATNAANACLGFSSVMNTANMMLDDGAGPAASFSGAILYKIDGGTKWSFRTSVGSTNVDTATQHTAGGAAAQVLRIEIRQGSSGAAGLEAVPFLNGQQMLDANGKPIKNAMTYTSAAQMQAGVYLKDGSGTGEVLNIDYIAAGQLR